MSEADVVERVYRLRPERGDVVAVHVADEDLANPDSEQMAALQQQLGAVSKETGVVFVILSETSRLEELDDHVMAAGGWVRVPDQVALALTRQAHLRTKERQAATAATHKARENGGAKDEPEDADG